MHDEQKTVRLMRAIRLTEDAEIDCSTCLDQVATYVDRELAGADVAGEMPHLHLHLALCGDCLEEYEALRDLAALDAAGLPEKAALLDQLTVRQRKL